MEAIFKMDEITDLSAKLSMSKIDDISKAIGINERIFTINELFGGNGNLFTNIINQLNACRDFDQAKALLIAEVAIPQQWEKEDKEKGTTVCKTRETQIQLIFCIRTFGIFSKLRFSLLMAGIMTLAMVLQEFYPFH